MTLLRELPKNNIKLISSLQNKKYRTQYGLIFVEGVHILEELAGSDFKVDYIVASDQWLDKHEHAHGRLFKGQRLYTTTEQQFKKLCDTETPQGIGAVVSVPDRARQALPASGLALYLDRIHDPGNIGTIFRTARWFGVDNVILSEDSVDVLNPKVIRSSLGAVFHLNIINDSSDSDILNKFKEAGYKVLAADMNGENLFQWKKTSENLLIIIGSEAHGVDNKLKEASDSVLSIPRSGGGESLNAAVAAAIFISQLKSI